MRQSFLDKTAEEFRITNEIVKDKEKVIEKIKGENLDAIEKKLQTLLSKIEEKFKIYNESINNNSKRINAYKLRLTLLEAKIKTAVATSAKILALIGTILTIVNIVLKIIKL